VQAMQEQQEPVPIHIRIDTQEQRSGIPDLLKSRFAPILLLEGDPLSVSHSRMRPESIRGALAYIAAILRVPILSSSRPADSAHLIYAVAKRCQVGKVHGRVEQKEGA
jgi:ERCC4-type nuclease